MKNVILVASILFCLNSCSKNDPTVKTSDYLPMKVGNYWIYQNYYFYPNNNVDISLYNDSVCISKDTIIHGNTYYKFERYYSVGMADVGKSIKFYRDSLGNLIDSNGRIEFSENNINKIILQSYNIINTDTLSKSTYKMDNTPIKITTPSGIYYNILTFKGEIKPYPNWVTAYNSILYSYYYYEKGIGLVSQNIPNLRGETHSESKLIRYHIIK